MQASWKELGITTTMKQQEWAQFLEFLGPPPNKAVDVYRLGWIGDFVDAINFLELWTCDSGNNNTNYCDKDYDALVEQAGRRRTTTARYEIYAPARGQAPRRGRRGADHRRSTGTRTRTSRSDSIKDTFNVNLLDQIDLTKVVVAGG